MIHVDEDHTGEPHGETETFKVKSLSGAIGYLSTASGAQRLRASSGEEVGVFRHYILVRVEHNLDCIR